ncbi:LysE family translocator [Chitinimonas naiadis]
MTQHALFSFALVALAMSLTPGPNMLYLVSRSVSQGRRAGYLSLGGVAVGFLIYMLSAALGITALLMNVPLAYDGLRIAGALYLLWMAWQAIRPGGASPFVVRELTVDSPRKLFLMGFLTNLLNPKTAVIYLSLLPQFIDPARGDVLLQGLCFGVVQIGISMLVNGSMITAAGTVADFLARRPGFAAMQRWLMASVLGGLAVRMAMDARR